LANSTADWIDTDATPNFGGAEDADYVQKNIPYRTGRTWLADVSELRVIQGFDEEIVQAIENWVCVRPNNDFGALNVNTITEMDWPLLVTYLGEDYADLSVDTFFSERPVNGFSDISQFFEMSFFANKELESDFKKRFDVRSDYYELKAEVIYFEAVLNVNSVLKISQSGDITTLSRRFGTF
jgi:general secretion pathway protein K